MSESIPIQPDRKFLGPAAMQHQSFDEAVGMKEYFEEPQARKYFVEPHIPGFAEFERWCDKTLREIGGSMAMINFALQGAHVTAVDISERSPEIARRRAAVAQVGKTFGLHLCLTVQAP